MIKDLWYKNAIIYCLHVGTFMDANGDGVGDFEGLSRKLDHLAGLGVTCVWLMPFQQSPRRDNGYDVSEYYTVDPRFGTLGDFVEFTHQAEQRGIRVLIDLVMNHTSNEHPWFQQARRNKLSKYRDYYVWSEKKPKDADRGMVFPGSENSTWTFDRAARAYYFHRFYRFQPDLNTLNPDVQAEFRKIMGFWLELGVAGFRMDAMPFVIESKGAGVEHKQNYRMLREIREFLQWRSGDAVLLAEANVLPKADDLYFGPSGDRMHMMFNFHVNQHLFYALASGDTRSLVGALHATRAHYETAQWATFLRNHDELDLGRLTAARRNRVFREFAPEECMQLYGRGIRRRLAPMLHGDRARWELAYSLLFALPGTPVLRYGDELGMGDNLDLPEREAARTAMQWSDEANAGFTGAKRSATPVISNGPYGFKKINAAEQRRDPESMLNWTERMIRLRKDTPELGWGTFQALPSGDPAVLVLRCDWRNTAVITIHNFVGQARLVQFRVSGDEGATLANLLTDEHSRADKRGVHQIELEPYGYHWYRIGGLRESTERSEA